MTEWRHPDNVVEEARYRLLAFKFPSFDRTFIEKLLAEIESLDTARAANVETCVAYAKRIEELRQQTEALTRKANFNEGLRDVAMRERALAEQRIATLTAALKIATEALERRGEIIFGREGD